MMSPAAAKRPRHGRTLASFRSKATDGPFISDPPRTGTLLTGVALYRKDYWRASCRTRAEWPSPPDTLTAGLTTFRRPRRGGRWRSDSGESTIGTRVGDLQGIFWCGYRGLPSLSVRWLLFSQGQQRSQPVPATAGTPDRRAVGPVQRGPWIAGTSRHIHRVLARARGNSISAGDDIGNDRHRQPSFVALVLGG